MSYNPNHADVFRTTLVQNGQLEMVEFCEDVGKMIGCDVEFENPSMRGVITTVLTKMMWYQKQWAFSWRMSILIGACVQNPENKQRI